MVTEARHPVSLPKHILEDVRLRIEQPFGSRTENPEILRLLVMEIERLQREVERLRRSVE